MIRNILLKMKIVEMKSVLILSQKQYCTTCIDVAQSTSHWYAIYLKGSMFNINYKLVCTKPDLHLHVRLLQNDVVT